MEIDVQTLIFVMVNFLVLVAILYKFMWGPVIRMIDSRQQTIDDSLHKKLRLPRKRPTLFWLLKAKWLIW